MKKVLIFIFTIFGLLLGWIAFMVYSYERSYNEWKSSRSGSKVTYPVENYASSSDRKNKEDLKSLMEMFKQRLFPITLLEPVDKGAYAKAKFWSEKSPLSEQQIKIYLTKYDSYTEDTSQSAVNKLNIDWKERAVLRAKSYQKFHYSKEYLVGQLVNDDLFTQKEADYAAEQVHFNWKENAVKEAESSANGSKISKEKILEILVENRKFTQEEAEYAIEHAQVDWLN